MVSCVLERMIMRYHFEPPRIFEAKHGHVYRCDHVLYSSCTLYLGRNRGLALIQQRYNYATKTSTWTELDPWLQDPIFEHPKFKEFFNDNAGPKDAKGLYPTIPVRKVMWALKMKPIKKEPWESTFDHKFV